jgi:hypothetical protein
MTQERNHEDGDADRLCRIPPGVVIDRLPVELRTAIRRVINPAYRELVEQVRSSIQKSAGLTLVWLLWLEILDHIQLGHSFTTGRSVTQVSEERQQLIDRHLRLVGSKMKASSFLLRLHEFEQKHGSMPGCSPNAGPSSDPVGDEPADAEV